MAMDHDQIQEAIERLIDSSSLSDVLDAVAMVCNEKARHLEHYWMDRKSAMRWDALETKISSVANSAHAKGI
jgi:hypothetical protein